MNWDKQGKIDIYIHLIVYLFLDDSMSCEKQDVTDSLVCVIPFGLLLYRFIVLIFQDITTLTLI